MRKQNKLVTVNKHNKNLFYDGGIAYPMLSSQELFNAVRRVNPNFRVGTSSMLSPIDINPIYDTLASERQNIINSRKRTFDNDGFDTSRPFWMPVINPSASLNPYISSIEPAASVVPKESLALDKAFLGIARPTLDGVKSILKPIDTSNIPTAKLPKSGFWSGSGAGPQIVGAVGNMVGSAVGNKARHGYTGGGGAAIGAIGSTVGGLLMTNPATAWLGAGLMTASPVIGAFSDRTLGTKRNEDNINAALSTAGTAKAVGDWAAKSQTSSGLMDAARNMTSNLGLQGKDYIKKGWARRLLGHENRAGNKYRDRVDTAIAMQNHGIELGENNIARNYKENALVNSGALGGLLNMGNIDPATAIGYDLLHQNALSRDAQANAKENTFTNLFAGAPNMSAKGGKIHIKKKNRGKFTEQAKRAGMGVQEFASHVLANKGRYSPSTVKRANFAHNAKNWTAYGGLLDIDNPLFAFGGNLEKGGADYPTGLVHIDEGGSHEENPYQGVQMGVDPQGTPNLVEEGETIWNDYVFSNRIFADGGTLKKFHLNEKREITYANLAKKLEKEISERVNDPLSQAAFDRQMAMLAEEQERQKQEEQAREAQEAFAQLPPEEQVALMQQEQQAQEQGMEEQAAQEQMMQQQPSEEEMMAQQMAAQQQMPPQGIMPQGITPDMIAQQGMPMMGAYGGLLNQYGYGGNLFRWGGPTGENDEDKNKYTRSALSWIAQNHPELSTEEKGRIASAMEAEARANAKVYNYHREEGKGWGEFDYERVWDYLPNNITKSALEWLRKNHPEIGRKDATHIAKAMLQEAKNNTSYYRPGEVSSFSSRRSSPYWDFTAIYNSFMPSLTTEASRKKAFDKLVNYGIPKNLAFSIAYDNRNIDNPEIKKHRDAMYNKWVKGKVEQPAVSTPVKANTVSNSRQTVATPSKPTANYSIIDAMRHTREALRAQLKNIGKTGGSNKSIPYPDILGGTHNSREEAIKASNEFFKQNPELVTVWNAINKEANNAKDAVNAFQDYVRNLANAPSEIPTSGGSSIESTLLANPNQVVDTLINPYYQSAPSQPSAPATLAPAPVPQGQGVSLESAVAQAAAQDNPAQATATTTATTPTIPVNPWDNNDLSLGQRILTSLDKRTWNDFMDWAKENKLDDDLFKEGIDKTDWNTVLANQAFKDALSKLDDTSLAHAVGQGYDYGNYKYIPKPADIQSINIGNWSTSGSDGDVKKFYDAWKNSTDEMWKQAKITGEEKSIKEIQDKLMATDAWKKTTDYLKASPDNMLNYLQAIESTPDAPEKAKAHYKDYVSKGEDGKLRWNDKASKMSTEELYDKLFHKVRTTLPGTYWHSFSPALSGEDTLNFIQDKNGNWAPLETGTDGLTLKRQYKYANDNGNHTLNYYISSNGNAVEKDAANKAIEELAEGKYDIRPRHRDNWMRYAPLFGVPINLGLMAAGVGKPNLDRYDAALAGYEPVTATYEPIGGYMTYRPMDIWAAQNAADAQARAVSREIVNNAAPIGQRMAGDIALAYNNDVNDGKRHREAMEYDDKLGQAVIAHKVGVDAQNAQAFNALSQYNASALNNYRQNFAGLRLNVADKKNEAEADWYNQLYGNIGQGLTALGKIGNEDEAFNMMAELAALGVFGPMNPNTAWGSRFFEIVPREDTTGQAAKGGKINRRRKGGLTY